VCRGVNGTRRFQIAPQWICQVEVRGCGN